MQQHKCTEATRILRLEKQVDGNGQPGLVKEVEQLKVNYTDMKEELASLGTSYKALVEAFNTKSIADKAREEAKTLRYKSMERISKHITLITAIAGVLIAFMSYVNK